jgi:hypothetical protein
MRLTRASWKTVGMVVIGLVGIALGLKGYSAPHLTGTGLPRAMTSTGTDRPRAATPSPGGAPGAAAPTRRAGQTKNRQRTAVQRSSRTASGATRPTGDEGAAPAARAPSAVAPGPLLSDSIYGPYAYQLYPGTPSADTEQALSGFQVSFAPVDERTEKVTVATAEQPPQSATFPRVDKLYLIETRMGDDGFDSDNNYGDDGFVLTDGGGHIIGK